MDKIILYSNNCPTCKIVKKQLKDKGVEFEEIHDMVKIREIADKEGIVAMPILVVNGEVFFSSWAVEKVREM